MSSVEAGVWVFLAGEVLRNTFSKRIKLVRLTAEPKAIAIGIAPPKRRLSPAAEKFWECAKEAASKNSRLLALNKSR